MTTYIINGKKYMLKGGYDPNPSPAPKFSMMPQPEESTDVEQIIKEVAGQITLNKN